MPKNSYQRLAWWMLHEIAPACKREGIPIRECPITAIETAALIAAEDAGELHRNETLRVFRALFKSRLAARRAP